jgi:hypothetical protein
MIQSKGVFTLEDWKAQLKQKANNRLTSKRITNYETVISNFKDQFEDLTKNIIANDKTVVKIDIIKNTKENKVFFQIFEYELGIIKEGSTIKIVKGDEINEDYLGEVLFEKGYSIVKLQNEEKHFLAEDIIDKLFKNAFESLLKS